MFFTRIHLLIILFGYNITSVSIGIIIIGCLFVPRICCPNILFYAVSQFITFAKAVLRQRIILFCRFSVPLDSFGFVFCDFSALIIAIAYSPLCVCFSLIGSFKIPAKCFFMISVNIIVIAQFILCLCVILLCGFLYQLIAAPKSCLVPLAKL